MKIRLTSVVVAVVLAASALVAPLGMSTASATAVTATFTPDTGTDTSAFDIYTSAACPNQTENTTVGVTLTGTGFPSSAPLTNAIGRIAATTLAYGQGLKISPRDTMLNMLNEQTGNPPGTVLSGRYDFTINCYAGRLGGSPTQLVVASMWFTTPTTYQTTNPNTGTTTTTTLAVSPASVKTGEVVTFTATMNPSSAAGTVKFTATAGTNTPIVMGTATVRSGVATLTYSKLLGGTAPVYARNYKIVAEFTGASATWLDSTSAEKTLVVSTRIKPLLATGSSPSFSPAPKVGTSTTCKAGSWTNVTGFTVKILSGSKVLATKTSTGLTPPTVSYKPAKADKGKTLTCSVLAKNTIQGTEATATKTAKVS